MIPEPIITVVFSMLGFMALPLTCLLVKQMDDGKIELLVCDCSLAI